jgi:hypothetical protein
MAELAWENIISSQRDLRAEKPRKTGCTMVMDVGKSLHEHKASYIFALIISITGNSALVPLFSWTKLYCKKNYAYWRCTIS